MQKLYALSLLLVFLGLYFVFIISTHDELMSHESKYCHTSEAFITQDVIESTIEASSGAFI